MLAPAFARVLKYSPTQRRGEKGTSQGGQFVRMDWGSAEPQEEPPPTHARLVDLDLGRAALIDRARQMAGPELLEELFRTGRGPAIDQFEVRAAVKQAIQADLTARLKDHPLFKDMEPRPPIMLEPVGAWVKEKIDLWAETAGDSSSEAVKMQLAVQEEFGLTEAETRHFDPVALIVREEERAKDRAFVRAEYEATQAFLKTKGMTHVSLFRGMRDDENALGYGFETVTMQPASSWTTDLDTAIDFATNEVGGHPKVLSTRVPISEVLSTCVTGRGCLPEQEFLLLGKPTYAQIFALPVAENEDEAWVDPDQKVALVAKIKRSLRS